MSERIIIINADDYGLTRGVSRAIRGANKVGTVFSTTAMMNMPGAVTEVETALNENPTLGIGVHLNMSTGRPILGGNDVPTLVNPQTGLFHSLRHIDPDAINPYELRREWESQIERMRMAGKAPDHLDSHHHMAYRSRKIFDVMIELARQYKLPIRAIPDRFKSNVGCEIPDDIPHPSRLLTGFYGDGATADNMMSMVTSIIEGGVVEIMTHPGLNDDVLGSVSSYTAEREIEASILCDPHGARKLAEMSVLTNFGRIYSFTS